jgi:uncharacterized protein with GYD domain
MPRYLTLITFTEQGVRDVKKTVKRADDFRKSVETAGGNVLAQYWAMGEVDGCVIFEAPDEEQGAALLVALAQKGNVRTRTMRLYDAGEFAQALKRL